MSTLMTLVAPDKTKIKASRSRVKSTPFSAKVSFKKVDQTDEEHVDFLGHKWNKVRDTITFKKTEIVAEEKPEIHGFCDAGEKAYGSAMFPWFAHGESLCLTPKEEVNTTLGVNGLSRALKVIAKV